MTPPRLDAATIWPTHGVQLGGWGLAYVPLPGTRYAVPAHFTVAYGDPRLPYDVELEVTMEATGPRCVNLDVRSRPDGPQVSGMGLRGIPIAGLLEQGARFMALDVIPGEDGGTTYKPAGLNPESRAEVAEAWRWARAAPRRAAFPPDALNLKLIGDLVRRALSEAATEDRKPTVYADVTRWLAERGSPVSRATAQRRIEEAQIQGFAPKWTKENQ